MQKVIRRTILAEKQAARRLGKRKEKYAFEEAKSARFNFRFSQRSASADIKTARQVRREDWELGPLAPRRDVGLKKDTYGTVETHRLQGKKLSFEERVKLNPLGDTIVKGDRVVLLEGRDRGKIGKVQSVDSSTQMLTVDGLNMADIAVPEWMIRADDQDQTPIRSMPLPVSVNAVKLVVPMRDRETGVKRDVIVREVKIGKVIADRYTGKKTRTRYIAGLGKVIPWPEFEKVEHKVYDGDSLRLEVENRTFVPTLLKPPMPMSVIDELRNKYSVFRTRHEDWYIEQKMKEDEAAAAKKRMAKEMRTPLNEFNRAARKLRKAKGIKKLTPVMLARIGEVIARRKQLKEIPAVETPALETSEAVVV